ncbi:MAG: flagellar protein [Veillonellaceae bacterium]|jgi:flagellar operon protein|nr:flagellar protein [Veillonellaceae bacterium]
MADNRIYYPQSPILPVQKPSNAVPRPLGKSSPSSVPFNKILEQQLTGVKFSQHAMQRLENRNIRLNQTDMDKLNRAVEKAAQKGAKESLVLMNNDLALIVSIKNKTVITAMDGTSIKDNVFTNIDSAVIV